MKSLKLTRILLITGAAITVLCLFLPVASSCRITPGVYNIVPVKIMGYQSFPYYLSIFFLAYITISGYFRNGIPAKVTMIIFTLAGIIVTQFSLQTGKAGWGNPCGNSLTGYQYLLNLGHLLIVVSAYIKAFSKDKGKHYNEELLDDFEE